MSDRTECSRALAKVLAYQKCGQDDKARTWARKLIAELGFSARDLEYNTWCD